MPYTWEFVGKSVEAAEKVNEKKYIKIQIKYDKNNLLIFVMIIIKGNWK